MPSVSVEVVLPRGVGGKRTIKAYAQAFTVQGYIKRINETKCLLQAEATKKTTLVKFFGSLYPAFEDVGVNEFDILTSTFSNLGRRTFKMFSIIESQEWKNSRTNLVSSDESTTTPKTKRVKYQNMTLCQQIEQQFDKLKLEESDADSGSSSPSVDFFSLSSCKYCMHELKDKIIVEVLIPGVSQECVEVKRVGNTITIETLSPKREVGREMYMGFRFGGSTCTTIKLPRHAGEVLSQKLDLGILTFEFGKIKVVSYKLPFTNQ